VIRHTEMRLDTYKFRKTITSYDSELTDKLAFSYGMSDSACKKITYHVNLILRSESFRNSNKNMYEHVLNSEIGNTISEVDSIFLMLSQFSMQEDHILCKSDPKERKLKMCSFFLPSSLTMPS
jgi:hypothetical protein